MATTAQPLTRPLSKHDENDAPQPANATRTTTLKLGTLSLSPSSSRSVNSSASDLQLMLLMDPYGLMDDSQPTKLAKPLSSNGTLPTELDADSLTYGLPSVLGNPTEDEEEYFDPYNTNIYGIQRQVSSGSLQTAASFHSNASRLMEAKQEASFYLEQTATTLEQDQEEEEEEEALLFEQADEKATRLEVAKKDVSFYLQEQFHDALESSSDEEEEDEPNTSLEHFQDEQQEEEDNFQDCHQTEQDQSSTSHQHSPTNVDFYLHELQDNEQIVDLKQEAEIDFYLQQENLQQDLIDLEQEPTPVIEKIASTTHRIDMDGAIRHKTVFYKEDSSPITRVPASKTLSFEDESGWSSVLSTPTSQESKVEALLPLDAPPVPPLPSNPTAAGHATDASNEPIISILQDEANTVTRVSLDQYISARVEHLVFQNPQQVTDKRRQITIQRIDMAGILQPTQIYGPFLDTKWEDEPSKNTNDGTRTALLATTLQQDLQEQKVRANRIMAQQQQEQVGCGCGWSFFGWFKRR